MFLKIQRSFKILGDTCRSLEILEDLGWYKDTEELLVPPKIFKNLQRSVSISKNHKGSLDCQKSYKISKNLKIFQKVSKDPLRISEDHQTFHTSVHNSTYKQITNSKCFLISSVLTGAAGIEFCDSTSLFCS